MTDEQQLAEKLKKIEALFAGAGTEGERTAAGSAIDRIKKKMEACKETDPPIEYRFSLNNTWSRRLFLALCRRYGIRPFRRYRQRHTTVMAMVSKSFVDETLWPEYEALNAVLRDYIDEITTRVISEAIYENSSEAEEVKSIG